MHGSGKEQTHHRKGKTSSTTNRNASRNGATFHMKIGNRSHRRLQLNTTGAAVLRKKIGKCGRKGVTTSSLKRKLTADTFPLKTKSNKKQHALNLEGGKLLVNRSDQMVNQAKPVGKSQQVKKRKTRIVGNANAEVDEAARLQRRTRYLLIKLKLEQNLIDAYSGEGWKGQSREKIRPDKELQRAKKQILKFKLGIRDAIRQLDMLSSVGCIEEVAPDGSVNHEHIICAKCKLREAFPDNDIILCDGTCNCAFHQKCLDPPLLTENIPPEDDGWLCKFCDCKMEILEAMNAHIGTHFSPDSQWQDIFREEAAFADGGMAVQNTEQDWPSEDSEDDDYDPERIESSCSFSGACSKTDPSDDASSSSSMWSLEDEVFSESVSQTKRSRSKQNTSLESPTDVGSHEATDCEIISGPRQRRAVDYTKLYAEMFGKDTPVNEQISEDEDWGPVKRKKREKSHAACTLTTMSETEMTLSPEKTKEVKLKVPDEQCKRSLFRIPRTAVEKLRLAFSENELPTRSTRENLSKQLGIDSEKINKWFKNARYMALKMRKAENAKQTHDNNTDCTEEFRSQIVEDNCADPSESSDTSSGTKLSKEVHRQKKRESLTSSLKKKAQSKVLDRNKGKQEYDDNVSLKHLKAFTKSRKKRVKFNPGSGDNEVEETAAEADMERILKIEGRVGKLKEALSHLLNGTSNKTDTDAIISSPPVVYVPEAVLREKM